MEEKRGVRGGGEGWYLLLQGVVLLLPLQAHAAGGLAVGGPPAEVWIN